MTNKGVDADDSSSTHQLADPERGLQSSSDFEPVHTDGKKGFQTVITTQDRGLQPFNGHNMGGIHVQNDTTVEVEKYQHTYALKR